MYLKQLQKIEQQQLRKKHLYFHLTLQGTLQFQQTVSNLQIWTLFMLAIF